MRRVRILTTYPTADASRRLRIEPLVREFERRGDDVRVHQIMNNRAFAWKNKGGVRKLIAGALTAVGIVARVPILMRKSDILVVHREAFPFFTPWIERIVAHRSKLTVLDVDDAIYASPTHVADWRNRLRDPAGALQFSSIFDVILCGNDHLAEVFGSGTADVTLSPTCPSPEVAGVDHRNDPIIAWIGSNSTLGSLQAVLSQVLSACESLSLDLHVLGGENVKALAPHPRLHASLWSETKELELLSRAAIGLMPLPANDWETGKSGFKAIQYLCAGATGIVSPVGINVRLAADFEAVRICGDGDWELAIQEAWSADPSSRESPSRAAANVMFDSAAVAERNVQLIVDRFERGRLS
jgi:hypothetical protein